MVEYRIRRELKLLTSKIPSIMGQRLLIFTIIIITEAHKRTSAQRAERSANIAVSGGERKEISMNA